MTTSDARSYAKRIAPGNAERITGPHCDPLCTNGRTYGRTEKVWLRGEIFRFRTVLGARVANFPSIPADFGFASSPNLR